jgi:hypothetical protein
MQKCSYITAREKGGVIFGIQDIAIVLTIHSLFIIYANISFSFVDQPRSKIYIFLFGRQVFYIYSAALARI